MKHLCLATTLFATLTALASHAIATPATVTFTGRVSDASGPLSGPVDLDFSIYTAPTGGALLWEESHAAVDAEGGLVFVNLGSIDPLDGEVFDGSRVFLEISVNGAEQSPRLPINSVPYATRAERSASAAEADTAATLGELAPADVALADHTHALSTVTVVSSCSAVGDGGSCSATATCPGTHPVAIGGGGAANSTLAQLVVDAPQIGGAALLTTPDGEHGAATGWVARARNSGSNPVTVKVGAICARASL
jgi:hypothetical protein